MHRGFFFALAQGARLSINLAFFDRPLIAAVLMGFVTDALPEALALGLVLELFWIDGLRLGHVVPPSATLSFLLLFPFCLLFEWYTAAQLPLPLFVCLVFAHVSAGLERWLRRRNTGHDAALELWVENPHAPDALSPVAYIWRSHIRVLWASIALYMLCFGVLYYFFTAVQERAFLPVVPMLSWNILYGLGLLGAVLALRTRRSYMALMLGTALILLSFCMA